MRVMFIVLALLAPVVVPGYAVERTLFSGDIEYGAFGGPAIKFTSFNGELAVLLGGQGGWILNHMLAVGGGGYWLVTDHVPPSPGIQRITPTRMGYGGVMVSYIEHSDYLFHPLLDVLIGIGSVGMSHDDHRSVWGGGMGHDAFFVAEPSVGGELNVTWFMRLAFNVSYRMASGVNSLGYSNSDVSGVATTLLIKFGRF